MQQFFINWRCLCIFKFFWYKMYYSDFKNATVTIRCIFQISRNYRFYNFFTSVWLLWIYSMEAEVSILQPIVMTCKHQLYWVTESNIWGKLRKLAIADMGICWKMSYTKFCPKRLFSTCGTESLVRRCQSLNYEVHVSHPNQWRETGLFSMHGFCARRQWPMSQNVQDFKAFKAFYHD